MQNDLEVTIKANFGSDFQKESNTEILKMMLMVFKSTCESKHKKNNVNIKFNNEDLL